MVMSVRYPVSHDDELLSDPGWRAQALDGAIRVIRMAGDPRWSALGSLVAAGSAAAWMMVVLLKHVPLGL